VTTEVRYVVRCDGPRKVTKQVPEDGDAPKSWFTLAKSSETTADRHFCGFGCLLKWAGDAQIEFEAAAQPQPVMCEACRGTGKAQGAGFVTMPGGLICAACAGSGKVLRFLTAKAAATPPEGGVRLTAGRSFAGGSYLACTVCGGSGRSYTRLLQLTPDPCPACSGMGRI
jgi:DnaJ-class molecular chaperone